MSVLIVDNNDSFTYNLKHYIEYFTKDVCVLRHYQVDLELVDSFEKIILSPGPGLPSDFKILRLILKKYAKEKSILGICLGHQAIAAFYGAKLFNLNQVMHAEKREILLKQKCDIFQNISSKIKVGNYNSWNVSKDDFPNDLLITSEFNDGTIASLRHKKHDIIGLQFNPESILTKFGLDILRNWMSF